MDVGKTVFEGGTGIAYPNFSAAYEMVGTKEICDHPDSPGAKSTLSAWGILPKAA